MMLTYQDEDVHTEGLALSSQDTSVRSQTSFLIQGS